MVTAVTILSSLEGWNAFWQVSTLIALVVTFAAGCGQLLTGRWVSEKQAREIRDQSENILRLQKAADDSKTAMLGVEKELTATKTKLVESEKSLLQLTRFATEPRVLNYDKAEGLLRSGITGSIELVILEGNVESDWLAMQLQLVFSHKGWKVSRRRTGTDEILNAGIALHTGSRFQGDESGEPQLDEPAKTLNSVLRTCITDNARGGSIQHDSRLNKDQSVVLIGPKY